jgi:NifU-like protein involved in Fe-S cluster formation
MMILGTMPRAVGLVENYPGRIVLLLFGLRLTRAGHPLVVGFWEALQAAIERYRSDEEEPKLTRSEHRSNTCS